MDEIIAYSRLARADYADFLIEQGYTWEEITNSLMFLAKTKDPVGKLMLLKLEDLQFFRGPVLFTSDLMAFNGGIYSVKDDTFTFTGATLC